MSAEIAIGKLDDFAIGTLTPVSVSGHALIVARESDGVHVARNHCPHLGFSLTRGPGGLRYSDGIVQCPWHNSRFDMCTGANLDWAVGFAGRDVPRWTQRMVALGRKPRDLPLLPTRVADDQVMVTVE
jgi:nitrite reductase/ring-hydroxylating ferredoxin subunit